MKTLRQWILERHRAAAEKIAADGATLAALAGTSRRKSGAGGRRARLASVQYTIWEEMLRPWGRAWAGLAAAWVGIALLWAGARESGPAGPRQAAAADAQWRQAAQARQVVMTLAAEWAAPPALEAPKPVPPRSETRPSRQTI